MSERLSARLTPDKLQNLVISERIKFAVESEKGFSKDAKHSAMQAILVPLTDAKQKSLQAAAKTLNLPNDPLGGELQDWLLKQFEVGPENKQYLDEALRHGVPHKVLNAKYHEREALIIAEAGRKGSVTIATNMAGRGVDILLGGRVQNDEIENSANRADDTDDFASETFASFRRGGKERAAPPLPLDDQERKALADEVRTLGGLYILGSERHESRRIDNQLRGRAGRQGDPGESRYFVALEDQLWKIFNARMMENPLLKAWPDLEQVNAKFLSSMIEKTQKRIELHFFEYRKHVLEYDDVLNAQREHIYGMRREFLLGKDPRPMIKEHLENAIDDIVARHAPDGFERTSWDYQGVYRELLSIFPAMDYGSAEELEGLKSEDEVRAKVTEWCDRAYQQRINDLGADFPAVEKFVLLRAITQLWTEHLQNIERLREGISLRGYGQVDPLIAFRKESHNIFDDTLLGIRDQVVQTIFRIQIQQQPAPPPQMQRIDDGPAPAASAVASNGQIDWSKVKRNDLCPCGSGKKFKHCHYREVSA
jgi:preprotein translocase subunit SecA